MKLYKRGVVLLLSSLLAGSTLNASVFQKMDENNTTKVQLNAISDTLGAEADLQNILGNMTKSWPVQMVKATAGNKAATGTAFTKINQTAAGKHVTGVRINMNDPRVKVGIGTANGTVSQAVALKSMAQGAKASINGTYFAAYNGAVPYPDGTLVKNGKTLHISDIGCTVGFTSDNKVLIDFVKTRVQGYVNGTEAWSSYRVNRDTSDPSTVILYTPENKKPVAISSGRIGVVCLDGKVVKYAYSSRTVPAGGFILVMSSGKQGEYPIGASVSYKTTFSPTNTSASDWEKVTFALSAGPSLLINGYATGSPADESFHDPKVLSQSGQRSFIGVNAKNEVIIGTTSGTISQVKSVAKQLGLVNAMCLDGGASSGLYYNGSYLTSPGRNISNCINFYYK